MTEPTRLSLPEALARHEAVLAPIQRPCVRLGWRRDAAGPGSSKGFGAPDLPPGAPWPVDDAGAPLPFAFQVNLAELAEQFPGRLPLPDRPGLLQFFTTFVAADDGVDWKDGEFDPDGGTNRILVHRDVSALAPVAPPVAAVDEEFGLVPEPALSLPHYAELHEERPGHAEASALLVDADVRTAYGRWLGMGDWQVGGYPVWKQDAGYAMAAMRDRGLYRDDVYGVPPQPVDQELLGELVVAGADWRLVVQAPSLVGDDGTFYFLAPLDDAGRFDLDRLQFVYQCT